MTTWDESYAFFAWHQETNFAAVVSDSFCIDSGFHVTAAVDVMRLIVAVGVGIVAAVRLRCVSTQHVAVCPHAVAHGTQKL